MQSVQSVAHETGMAECSSSQQMIVPQAGVRAVSCLDCCDGGGDLDDSLFLTGGPMVPAFREDR